MSDNVTVIETNHTLTVIDGGSHTVHVLGGFAPAPTATSVGATIAAATAVTELADTSLLGVVVGGVMKRLTGAAFWTWLTGRLGSAALNDTGDFEPDGTMDTHELTYDHTRIVAPYDDRSTYTPTDTDTITHPYGDGGAFSIDASALTTGEAFTLAISDWPAGVIFGAVTIVIKTGADVGFTMTWPNGVVPPTFEADKLNVFTLFNADSGSYRHIISGGAFDVSP